MVAPEYAYHQKYKLFFRTFRFDVELVKLDLRYALYWTESFLLSTRVMPSTCGKSKKRPACLSACLLALLNVQPGRTEKYHQIRMVFVKNNCPYCYAHSNKNTNQWFSAWSRVADLFVCICLQERNDRFKQACDEFHKVGLCSRILFYRPTRPLEHEFQQFKKLFHNNTTNEISSLTIGSYGCFKSHQYVNTIALQLGIKRLLVFEDDVMFLPHTTPFAIESLKREVNDTNISEWDTWHLGYLPLYGYPKNLSSLHDWRLKCLSTVAYISNVSGMKKIVGIDNNFRKPIDVWMMNSCKQMGTVPKLVWQRDSPTSVEEIWLGINVTSYKERANQFYRRFTILMDYFILIVLPILLIFIFFVGLIIMIRKLAAVAIV